MSKIAIILVHLGEFDPESKDVLDAIAMSGVQGITKISADNDSIQGWLRNNTKGVVVTKYPSFLVAQEGKSTQIYGAAEVNEIIEMARKLTQG